MSVHVFAHQLLALVAAEHSLNISCLSFNSTLPTHQYHTGKLVKILNANGNLMFTIDAYFFSISEWCMLILPHILKCVCVATIGMVRLNEMLGSLLFARSITWIP